MAMKEGRKRAKENPMSSRARARDSVRIRARVFLLRAD